jgi:predicted ATP-dependent endonuclease of OLD family
MLAGVFLRHYKIYRNINFIPISTGEGLSAFLGPNGVGKSSILDAMDKFFNGGDWSINAQAKNEGGLASEEKLPYIVPLFVIEKNQLPDRLIAVATALSDYLWETNLRTADALSVFQIFRAALVEKGFTPHTHFLLAIGRQHGHHAPFFGPFSRDAELQARLDAIPDRANSIGDLVAAVRERYAYFYIPVETDPISFSKLESTHVQKLLDEDIQKAIRDAIGKQTISQINVSLSEFVSQINDSLMAYQYKGTYKNQLTMNDLIEKVFEAYFSIKVLHKEAGSSSIPIREMSAGEKRRALIDLSYSLLKRNAKRVHNVILAIDEPDASLHVSACHDQFERLAEIPDLTDPKSQVLLTTHWYGFLPIVQNGIAHSISQKNDKVEFCSFDLYNFREEIREVVRKSRGELPRDIELKSYNDMLQAIIGSTLRADPYNWILCEGLSDKIYLEFYLGDLVKERNLRIVPLGGFKEVRRAYQYLKTPLDDPEYKINGKGRVLCLVDTDTQLERIDPIANSKAIAFMRLICDEAAKCVNLVSADHQKASPATEMEDALDGERFEAAIAALAQGDGGHTVKTILAGHAPDRGASCALSFLNLPPSAGQRMRTEFFDRGDNKIRFARSYVGLDRSIGRTPVWIDEIRRFFKGSNSRKAKT